MKLTCHCGNIELTAAYIPKEIANCNCSICRRYAASWAYYEPKDVSISHTQKASGAYIWGDKEVAFHHCTLCGCITHYVTTDKCDANVTAINMCMADNEIKDAIPVRKIDGAAY